MPHLNLMKFAPAKLLVVTGTVIIALTMMFQAANACTIGTPTANEVVSVTGSHTLHDKPSEASERVVNQKASGILKRIEYQNIDQSETLQTLCQEDGWTLIRVASPPYLTDVQGWVPNSALRSISQTADGSRMYVEDDFSWDEETTPYKSILIKDVNYIVRHHPGCPKIDTATLFRDDSNNNLVDNKNDPVFFITCLRSDRTTDVFNVWFYLSGEPK